MGDLKVRLNVFGYAIEDKNKDYSVKESLKLFGY